MTPTLSLGALAALSHGRRPAPGAQATGSRLGLVTRALPASGTRLAKNARFRSLNSYGHLVAAMLAGYARCSARLGPGVPGRGSVAEGVVMGQEGRDPVIELDERGIDLLKSWAHPCTQFRVTTPPDGSIVLHPMSAHDLDLWRSGLVDEIIGNFSHPERMIRLKADKL